MKVALLIPSLSTGGAERTMVSLSNWLADNNVETYLINLGINDNNYNISEKVHFYNKEQGKNIFQKIKNFFKVIKYLNNIKPDIIFEMLFSPIKYAMIYKLANRKVSIIGSERNNPKLRYKNNIKLKLLSNLCPLLCDGYIFQTERVKEMFSKRIQKKSIVIGNAISRNLTGNLNLFMKKEKIISAAGRLTYQKGFDTLIKAFWIVHERYPEYKLFIYGEGEERQNLEQLIENMGIEKNVFLPGKCKDYLERVSIGEMFVMTSRFEGMPNVLLESMSIGMPCISTNCVAGPSEIIQNNKNGILVEVDNIEEIAKKMLYFIENKEIALEYGKQAQNIQDKFSPHNIFNRYYKYFRKIFIKKTNNNLWKRIFFKLENLEITNMIPDKIYLEIMYKIRLNSKLNLKNPKTFNEKMQWIKLYDRNPLYTILVDKYEVREYVKSKIGDEYLIPLIGKYDSFEEINFEELPNEFVIKCTHDSGGIVICKNKSKLNISEAKKKIETHLKRNFYYHNREWPYRNVKPRIIIEKYMKNENDNSLKDYKFYCFDGEPRYLYVSEGLEDHSTAKISFFDMNFEFADFHRDDYEGFSIKPKKPINFDKMKELARNLSRGRIFLRVDFYEINGKIYFSELTFTPCGGFMPFNPQKYDKKLGELVKLPNNLEGE